MTGRFAPAVLLAGLLLAAAAIPAVAQEGTTASDAAWARARALADDQHYDEALAVTRSALDADPDNTELLWLEAGIVGWSGRHSESILLFEALAAKHPELADRVRLDMAMQKLWANDPHGALADADLYLSSHPGDREARRSRALILSFSDRLREAEAEYEALLAEDPKDNEARAGYARALNWDGRHRDATRVFEELRAAGVRDPDVLRGQAYAEYWSDRPDRAREPLARLLEQRPSDPEGLALQARLDRETRPAVTLRHSVSDDSDDLRVLADGLDFSHPIGERDVAFFMGEGVEVKDPGGEHHLKRAGVGHRRIWSDSWTTTERLNFQYERSDTLEDKVLWDLGAVYRRSDRLRLDFGASRDQVLTRLSLDNNITVVSLLASAEYQITPRWSLGGSIRRNDYEDDNWSWLLDGVAAYKLVSRRDLTLTADGRARYLTAHRDLDHGYYDPGKYAEAGPGAIVSWTPRPGWVVEGTGRVGLQKEQGGDTEPMSAIGGRVEIPIARPVTVGGDFGRSDSNLSSESGFERTAWSVFLTGRF